MDVKNWEFFIKEKGIFRDKRVSNLSCGKAGSDAILRMRLR